MAFVQRKRKPFLKRKRISELDLQGINYIDYKDVDTLSKYVNAHGKILPSKITGVSAKRQRMLATAIKRAREMALLEFTKERIRTTAKPKRERFNRNEQRPEGERARVSKPEVSSAK
ncbi:small subunit ribosomal protein S18 [Mycoplasma testudineum]|uniref:Small ribosomal subunit protein bS18 n=1 Tax=Mycoplasma testudineum TaxID=244584 RepID=A0A4R6IH26_9MOLU|nr:30S ribosomal protein S18 [Mycoplasma testudineum]TDO21131.1 small subunit ribosomal protein S18 [Mycoplasma testudineum]